MYDLYKRFNIELSERGLSYPGQMYKRALEIVKETAREDFPYKKYVFVGLMSSLQLKKGSLKPSS